MSRDAVLDNQLLVGGSIGVMRRTTTCRILFHRHAVTEAALCELQFWLAGTALSPIMLSWYEPVEQDWQHQILRTRDAVGRKLLELTTPEPKHFVSLARDPADLDVGNPFAPLFDVWRKNAGALQLPDYGEHLTGPLHNRFYLVKLGPDGTSLNMHLAGHGCPLVNSNWASNCAGTQMEDQADVPYAVAVARVYRQVAQTGEPAWTDISADMDLIGQGPQRAHYQRLLLPLNDRQAGRWVLGATYIDCGVIERVEAA